MSFIEYLEQSGERIKNFMVEHLLRRLYTTYTTGRVESYEDAIQKIGDEIKAGMDVYEAFFASIRSGGKQLSLDVQDYLRETYGIEVPRFEIDVYRTKGTPDLRILKRYKEKLQGKILYFFDDSVLTGRHAESSRDYMRENKDEWGISDALLVTLYDTQDLADITVFRIKKKDKKN